MAQMRADQDVLAHREAGEGLHDLERARDPASRQLMRRQAGDGLPKIAHDAGARPLEAGDDGKQGGLARSVRSNQRGDAASRSRQRGGVHRQQTAEAARHAIDREQRLSHARPPVLARRDKRRRAPPISPINPRGAKAIISTSTQP